LTRRPWTEKAEKGMVRLGALIPSYRMAATTYTELVGLSVAAATLEEVTVVVGQRLNEVEGTLAEASVALPLVDDPPGLPSHAGAGEAAPAHLCISLDGAKVNTTEGWREVKTVAVSAVEPLAQPAPDGTRMRLVQHSYRAGFWEAKEFATVQWAEAKRRGVEQAARVTSVNDGAEWIWLIVLLCYPTARAIVDWWHVVDRLWQVGNLVGGQGTTASAAWVKARKEELWQGHVAAVGAALTALTPRSAETQKDVRLLGEYLRTHAERMRYQEFRDRGEPVGSGTVESACKNVVGTRLKRGGMRWKVERAEAVLAVRCAILSDRWPHAWEAQRQVA
jgi:hypothetical protein